MTKYLSSAMRRRALLLAAAVLIPAMFCPVAGAGDKTNIVFILIDDLGWADLSCYGNKFHRSPNIDRLASQGMRFTDAYAASPVCSSTRCSIMTGKYPATVGITDFIPGHWLPWEQLIVPPIKNELPLAEISLAEPLKAHGYATCYLGKWHLGGPTHFPAQQGFDVGLVQSGRHFGARLIGTDNIKLKEDEYLADRLTDEALGFIEQHQDEPFMVTLSHYAVHIPLQAKQAKIAKYEARAEQMRPRPKSHPTYAAMIEHVDESVGRIMQKLDELKLADKTAVIFFSDNGGLIKRFDGKGPVVAPQTPLRNEKGSVYEGGIRVPMIVRWPGVVEPKTLCGEAVSSVDIFPTMMEIAGAQKHARHKIDGLSLTPLLKQRGGLKREAIYFHYPHYHHMDPAGAIRAGDYKLIEHFDDGELELYNLRDDLSEKQNLAKSLPQKARSLQKQLAAWRKSVGALMPTVNPEFDPTKRRQWKSRRNQGKAKAKKRG